MNWGKDGARLNEFQLRRLKNSIIDIRISHYVYALKLIFDENMHDVLDFNAG